MNFEPQKFFIGLIDFFSIILPGALLAYIIGNSAWEWIFGKYHALPNGAEGWIVFLFASYLLGHLIFLVSAWIDEFYDRIRNSTLDTQIKHLAWHGRLAPAWKRGLLWLIFKRERNIAVDRVGRIKAHYLGKIGASGAVNTFQWSKARLAIEHPESLATVHRFEADSKFFRSLSFVLLVLTVWYLVKPEEPRYGLSVTCLALMLLALWRYLEQRHKSTIQAYWSIIALEGKNGNLIMTKPQRKPGEPTHAGGIVFRDKKHVREFLLVQAKKTPNEWVLPKGHIELDEHPRETAVREVREETGVWGEIVGEGDVMEYELDGQQVRAQFYLMKARASGHPEDRWRGHEWLSLEKAVERLTHPKSKDFLKAITEHADSLKITRDD